jgi:hypothetical protein
VTREWVKSSSILIDERIISFTADNRNGRRQKFFRELDYVLKNESHYCVGELKVSSLSVTTKASRQLAESFNLLRHISDSIELHIIHVDLSYEYTKEPIDEFCPDFSKSTFRTVEINGIHFKILHLNPNDIFKWGVDQKVIKTPELLPAAMKENSLICKGHQIKIEISFLKRKLKETQDNNEKEQLQNTLSLHEIDYKIIRARVELSQQGWAYLADQSGDLYSQINDRLGKTLSIIEEFSYEYVSDFHTDNPQAKFITFYGNSEANNKQSISLMDAEKIYHLLSESDRKEIEKVSVLSDTTILQDTKEDYLLINNCGLRRFYYSNPLTINEHRNNIGLIEFRFIMYSSTPIIITVKQNDIILIDNHRILHKIVPADRIIDVKMRKTFISE